MKTQTLLIIGAVALGGFMLYSASKKSSTTSSGPGTGFSYQSADGSGFSVGLDGLTESLGGLWA